ncbi:30S ribosomal protein THX [Kaistella anthropi]|nr:30S ribosomal protein THX [Kaistella anthropi]
MGKGDQKSRRGKVTAGSYGKKGRENRNPLKIFR